MCYRSYRYQKIIEEIAVCNGTKCFPSQSQTSSKKRKGFTAENSSPPLMTFKAFKRYKEGLKSKPVLCRGGIKYDLCCKIANEHTSFLYLNPLCLGYFFLSSLMSDVVNKSVSMNMNINWCMENMLFFLHSN